MKRWILFGTIVATLLIPGQLLPDESFVLEYRYSEGQVLKYDRKSAVEIRSEAIPGGRTVMDEQLTQVLTVDVVRPDGLFEVVMESESVVIKVNSETVPAAKTLSGVPVDLVMRMVTARTGHIESVTAVSELTPEGKVMVENLFENMKNLGLRYPEKSVRPGDSWADEVIQSMEIPNLGPVDISMTMTYTVEGIEDHEGYRCARIAVVGEGNGSIGEGVGTLGLTTAGFILHALKDGIDLFFYQKEDVDITIITPDGPLEINKTTLSSWNYVSKSSLEQDTDHDQTTMRR